MSGDLEVYWTRDIGEGWEREEESRLVILIVWGS